MNLEQMDLQSDAGRQLAMRLLLQELGPAWRLDASGVALAFLIPEQDQSAWLKDHLAPTFTEDQLVRFGFAFTLHESLCDAFNDREQAYAWINRPNTSELTQGMTALEFLESQHYVNDAWRALIGHVNGGLYG